MQKTIIGMFQKTSFHDEEAYIIMPSIPVL